MPLFSTAKEDRNRLTRSPPGSLRRTRPLVPRIPARHSPQRSKGALLLDVPPPAEPTTNETAMGSPVHPQDNTPQVHTPPAQDTYLLDDVLIPPIRSPMYTPMQSDVRQGGFYHVLKQENPEIEDIIVRARRQVAFAVEAEIVADRATEAARAAVQEARRLLVELERQIGADTERALSRKQEAEFLVSHAQNLGRYN